MKEEIEVKVGQIWIDNDKRITNPRRLLVLEVVGRDANAGYAIYEINETGRKTNISRQHMKIRLLFIIGGFAIGLLLGTWILRAQTQLSLNSQVSPASAQTLTSLYTNILPTASGMLYATLKNSATGVMTPYVLVPPGTAFVFNPAQWQAVPLSLPRGTGVTCSQVKP